ncbi:MAG: exodeoxyribonuclease VII small subunit [Lachnospiraceae bacterium]|nr:exodeoxyribonuclease VII small subunit [Lachnospiraceae bacterium]
MADKKELTIEESFSKLQEILDKMEDDETGLEESFKLYEEGIGLVKKVSESIDKVEKRIKILSEEE